MYVCVLIESPVSQSDAVLLGYPLQMPLSHELRINDLSHYQKVQALMSVLRVMGGGIGLWEDGEGLAWRGYLLQMPVSRVTGIY